MNKQRIHLFADDANKPNQPLCHQHGMLTEKWEKLYKDNSTYFLADVTCERCKVSAVKHLQNREKIKQLSIEAKMEKARTWKKGSGIIN